MKSALRILVCLNVLLMCQLFTVFAVASPTSRSLDSVSSVDLSSAILRDNYDVWAGEILNRVMLENTKEISQTQDKIYALSVRESQLAEDIKTRLKSLVDSEFVDESSVQAALLLARASSGQERLNYLRKAVTLSEKVAPGSKQALRVSLVLLSEHLRRGDRDEATRSSTRILQSLNALSSEDISGVCIASVLLGDVYFLNSDFTEAEANYTRSAECLQRPSALSSVSLESGLSLRRAWVSFRLMKYAETLSRLENFAARAHLLAERTAAAVSADLSIMLGVSLSELSMPNPPSVWIRHSSQNSWVARGLVRAVKYLIQKEQVDNAARWVDQLESLLSQHPVALDFYVLALEAFEKSRPMDSFMDLRNRAVVAMHPHGRFAQSLVLSSAEDSTRRARLIEWARSSIAQYMQQDAQQLSRNTLSTIFRVAETLVADSLNVCGELESLSQAHQVLAAGQSDALAERVYLWFKDCADFGKYRLSVTSSRIDMFRAALLRSGSTTTQWDDYYQVVRTALEGLPRSPEIRRAAISAVSDAFERAKFTDSEALFIFLVSSFEAGTENSQLELDSLVDAGSRLLSQPIVVAPLEVAGWSLLGFLQTTSGIENPSRRLFEASLGDWIHRQALRLTRDGKFKEAIALLNLKSTQFAAESLWSADLAFEASRLACLNALDRECIALSQRFIDRKSASADDRFLARHWQAGAFERTGRYIRAAESWLDMVTDAVQSQRSELLALAKIQVAKAGSVFAELKMWDKVLLARSALINVAFLSGDNAGVHDSVLRWALQASDSNADDVFAALSIELVQLESVRASRGKRAVPPQTVLHMVGPLVEGIAGARSVEQVQRELFATLERMAKRKVEPGVADRRDGLLVDRFLSRTIRRWQSELLSDTDKLSRLVELNAIENASDTLLRRFNDSLRGCRIFEAYAQSRRANLRGCEVGFSAPYRLYVQRLEIALRNVKTGEIQRARQVATKLSQVSSVLAASSRMSSNASSSSAGVFDEIAERKRNLLSSVDAASGIGGAQ